MFANYAGGMLINTEGVVLGMVTSNVGHTPPPLTGEDEAAAKVLVDNIPQRILSLQLRCLRGSVLQLQAHSAILFVAAKGQGEGDRGGDFPMTYSCIDVSCRSCKPHTERSHV